MRKTNGAMVVMCLPPCDRITAPRTMKPTNEESRSLCSPFLLLWSSFFGYTSFHRLGRGPEFPSFSNISLAFAHYLRMHILYELGKERGEHIYGVFLFFPPHSWFIFLYHFTPREWEGSLLQRTERVLLHFFGPVIFSSRLHIFLWPSKSERGFL